MTTVANFEAHNYFCYETQHIFGDSETKIDNIVSLKQLLHCWFLLL
jgi:hypothetical protein